MSGGNPLAQIFGGMVEEPREHKKTEPTILVHTLNEILAAYRAPCPFQVGDLVMPRRGMPLSGEGEPHIVAEVFETPLRPTQASQVNGLNYNARIDMRVLHEHAEHIMAHCVESWMFERYVPKVTEGTTRN